MRVQMCNKFAPFMTTLQIDIIVDEDELRNTKMLGA